MRSCINVSQKSNQNKSRGFNRKYNSTNKKKNDPITKNI